MSHKKKNLKKGTILKEFKKLYFQSQKGEMKSQLLSKNLKNCIIQAQE